jgi:hypothetical protein
MLDYLVLIKYISSYLSGILLNSVGESTFSQIAPKKTGDI